MQFTEHFSLRNSIGLGVWMDKKPTFQELEQRIKELEREISNYEQEHKDYKKTQFKYALKKSENKFRSIVEISSDWIWEVDKNGVYTYTSPKVLEILGYEPQELIGKITPYDLMPADEAEQKKKLFIDIVRSRKPFDGLENITLHKNGQAVVLETSGVPIFDEVGNLTGYRGIDRDITARKQAEKDLVRLAEEWQITFDSTNDAMWVFDCDQRIQRANKKAVQMFQKPGMTLIGKHCWEFVHSTEQPIPECPNKRAKHSLERETMELQIEKGWFQVIVDPILNSNGQYSGAVHIITDITERKIREDAYAEKTTLLNNILQNAHDVAIATTDLNFRINYYNPTAEKLFGYTAKEVVGKTVQEMHTKDNVSADRFDKAIKQVQQTGSYLYSWEEETDNGKRYIDSRIFGIFDESGKLVGYSLFSREVTSQKEARELKLQASRMESISTLTGGLAHDFNNLLSVIMGNIELAKSDIEKDAGIAEFLNQAENASLQLKELTRQLMTFSKGGAPIKKAGSIASLLKEVAGLVLMGSDVTCKFILPPNLWSIEFDKDQMKHAIKNLIVNSLESMPEGGTITVKAENFNATSEQGSQGSTGEYVKLSIQDHGIGIDSRHLSMIFDPYFSTKKAGTQKGLGLGLATTYSIVNRHGGRITVESETGVGTIFTLYLLTHEKSGKNSDPKAASNSKKPAISTRRILLMDDEKMIRNLGKKMLKRLGYDTGLAKDGFEAVDLYKKALDSGRPFEAVILDLTIKGGMGGKEAVKKILKLDSQAKAIVASGYSSDPVMTDYSKYGFIGVLQKPYSIKNLKDELNKICVLPSCS